MIGNLEDVGEPALGDDLDQVGDDGGHHDAGKDQHGKVRLLGHEQRTSLQTVDGQTCDQHSGDAVTGDAQSHHGDQRAAQRSVVCSLGCPHAGGVALAKAFGILADALGIAIGDHVGDTGAHAGQEADPQTGSECKDNGLDVFDDVLEADAKTLHVLDVHIGHLCLALGVVTDDLAHGEHTQHLCNGTDAGGEVHIAKGEAGSAVDGVHADAAHEQTDAGGHDALEDVALGQGGNKSNGAEAQGEVFPGSQMQSRLCDHRGQHGGDRHRAHSADEGSGHADAQRLACLSLLGHGITVKAGGNGRGRTGDADEHRRDKGTGHAADPDGKQHDKGSLGGKTKGDGQQQSDAQSSGQTGDCTKDDAQRDHGKDQQQVQRLHADQ